LKKKKRVIEERRNRALIFSFFFLPLFSPPINELFDIWLNGGLSADARFGIRITLHTPHKSGFVSIPLFFLYVYTYRAHRSHSGRRWPSRSSPRFFGTAHLFICTLRRDRAIRQVRVDRNRELMRNSSLIMVARPWLSSFIAEISASAAHGCLKFFPPLKRKNFEFSLNFHRIFQAGFKY